MPPKRIQDLPSRQLVQSHLATDWGGPYDNPSAAVLACVLPTMTDLRARFPEFASYSDAQVNFAIEDASSWADSSWTTGNCTKAILFLAAHFLFLQAQAALQLPQALPDGSGGTTYIEGGQVTSISFETMRVGFAKPQLVHGGGGKGSGDDGPWDLTSSPYGQRYLSLLKANVPAVLVV